MGDKATVHQLVLTIRIPAKLPSSVGIGQQCFHDMRIKNHGEKVQIVKISNFFSLFSNTYVLVSFCLLFPLTMKDIAKVSTQFQACLFIHYSFLLMQMYLLLSVLNHTLACPSGLLKLKVAYCKMQDSKNIPIRISFKSSSMAKNLHESHTQN
jgi:hypothetical protein